MWHKICFNCATCHRPLDSTLACDGPDKEVYCRSCYGKYFGPKGFGYGHSPTLVSTKGESTMLLYVLTIKNKYVYIKQFYRILKLNIFKMKN